MCSAPSRGCCCGYASVLGRSFNPLVWRRSCRDDGIEMDDGVTGELRQFVEFDPAASARFRQAVVRDVAYRGSAVPPPPGAAPAGGAGDGASGRGSVDSVADLLSVHFYEGGDLERAWRYAARWRVPTPRPPTPTPTPPRCTGGPWRRPAGWSEVEPDEIRATWTALGDVLEQAGLPDEAMDAYRRATALAGDDQVERARLLLKRAPGARARRSVRRCAAGAQRGRAGSRATDRGDDAARVRVAVDDHASRSSGRGRSSPAGPSSPPRRRRRRPSASTSSASWPRRCMVIDTAHALPGRARPGGAPRPRGRDPPRCWASPIERRRRSGTTAWSTYWRGRWDEALDCYQRAHDAYVETGDVVNAAVQQGNIGRAADQPTGSSRPPVDLDRWRPRRPIAPWASSTARLFDEIQLGRLLLGEGDLDGGDAVLEAVLDRSSGALPARHGAGGRDPPR